MILVCKRGYAPNKAPKISPSPELPEFVAGLVHEVKNPLAAIHLHLQLLQNYVGEVQEEKLRNKINDKIVLIQDEILNLNQTLHSFLSVMQAQTQNNIYNFELDDLLEQIVKLLEPQLKRDDIQIVFEKSKLAKIRQFNPALIRQIILNLILNAIQAFKNLNEASKNKEKFIWLSSGIYKASIYVEIKDNGPGISKDVQEKMFDAFYTTHKKRSGGLGLTLVQHIIESIGARLEVQSETGKGARFIVWLNNNSNNSNNKAKLLR